MLARNGSSRLNALQARHVSRANEECLAGCIVLPSVPETSGRLKVTWLVRLCMPRLEPIDGTVPVH
jgi:hypothetical protein